MLGQEGPSSPVCSKRDCDHPAGWAIRWRNPKIHDESRVKTWLACDDHRAYFLDYLGSRGFPVRSEEFSPGEH